MKKQPFIQYQDKNQKRPHTLSSATRLASELVNKLNCDVYVVGKRIMGDYWIGVMTEKAFFPYTRLKTTDKFHDILRVKRFKFEGWVRDPNQGVKKDAE
tara:strand:+ start:863 stop:1159 length:297 start_codon:yes stop_codon:yes gene_type:complete